MKLIYDGSDDDGHSQEHQALIDRFSDASPRLAKVVHGWTNFMNAPTSREEYDAHPRNGCLENISTASGIIELT